MRDTSIRRCGYKFTAPRSAVPFVNRPPPAREVQRVPVRLPPGRRRETGSFLMKQPPRRDPDRKAPGPLKRSRRNPTTGSRPAVTASPVKGVTPSDISTDASAVRGYRGNDAPMYRHRPPRPPVTVKLLIRYGDKKGVHTSHFGWVNVVGGKLGR